MAKTKCKHPPKQRLYEGVSGMLVYRVVAGRKTYAYLCQSCGFTGVRRG